MGVSIFIIMTFLKLLREMCFKELFKKSVRKSLMTLQILVFGMLKEKRKKKKILRKINL